MFNNIHIVAKLGAPYGVQGWISLHSFTEVAENIFSYKPLYIQKKGSWKLIKITNWKAHKKSFVVKIQNIDDRNQVEQYTNLNIGADASSFPEPEEGSYYWYEMQGYEVKNIKGEILGEIFDIFETGANDVIVVKNNKTKKEILIPYIDTVILDINRDLKQMLVDWESDF